MLDVLAGTDSSGRAPSKQASSQASKQASKEGDAAAQNGDPAAAAPSTMRDGQALQTTLFGSSNWTTKAVPTLDALCAPIQGKSPVTFDSSQARNFVHQVLVLVRRTGRMYARNVPMNLGRIAAITFLCLLFGTIYFDLANRSRDYQGTRTLVAAIFMTAAFSAMLNMDANLPTLIGNRPTFYREQSSLIYSSGAYAVSNLIVEIPWLAGIVLGGTSIGYFMIGLTPDAGAFFTHYLATLILALVFVSFGGAVASSMPSFDSAQAVVGLLAPILFLFGGMFSKPSSMPPGSKWVNTIDPIAYAFRALIPLHFKCEGGVAAGCPTISVPNSTGVYTWDRMEFINDAYELSYDQIWPSIGYTAIFIGVFQFFNVLATYRIRHISR